MALTDECKNRTAKTEITVNFVQLKPNRIPNPSHFCQPHTPNDDDDDVDDVTS